MEVGKRLIMAVFGGLIAYYVTTIFTTSLITGTTTADTLKVMGAFNSNVRMKTGLTRRTLKVKTYADPELNIGNEPIKCVETKTPCILKWDGDIVRTLQKCRINGRALPIYSR